MGGHRCVCAQSLQLCLILHSPMDCSPPGSSVRDSPGKNTGVGCCALRGIFLTPGSNSGLLRCRQILYCWATGEAQGHITWMITDGVGCCLGGTGRGEIGEKEQIAQIWDNKNLCWQGGRSGEWKDHPYFKNIENYFKGRNPQVAQW